MTSIRRIATVIATALFAAVAGASSAFAQVVPDAGTGSGTGVTGTTAPTTGGGTPTITYIVATAAAIAFVALVVMTARTLRAHTRRNHVAWTA